MPLYRFCMRLHIAPEYPALDTELSIRVSQLPPAGRVTLRAHSTDAAGQAWVSQAAFTADRDGLVDLRRDPPVAGSYRGADPMGLVWSMLPAGAPEPGHVTERLAPVALWLTAEADEAGSVSAGVWRSLVPDGLVRTEVASNGLTGALFHPAGDGPWRGVVQLGGAEGGMHEDDAALLAAHGFTVLALAYFGMPGLPPTLRCIPVEYFGRALDYLQAHPKVTPGGITVMGVSKGSEAALLTGATYPDAVRSVISIVGSAVHTQGISQDIRTGSLLEILETPVASWTYQGQDLPYLRNVVTPRLRAALAAGDPVSIGWAFPDLSDAAEVEPAMIPVDRISGPVLLLSAGDDGGYGAAYHEIAIPRLRYPARHIVYEHAGHPIAGPPYRPTPRAAPPYRPTPGSGTPGPDADFQHTGIPAADAAARAGAWHQIREFLQ
jgi:dienelactone hydrolase